MRVSVVAVWVSLAFLVPIPTSVAQTPQPMQTGYARLLPDPGTSSPAGVAILGMRSNGVLITETGVPATETIQSGRIFAEVGGVVTTGVAFANPADQAVVISFYFTDQTGRDFGAGTFTLRGKQQIASFLTQQPFGLPSTLLGTFTFNASGPVAAIGLRNLVNQRNEVLMTTIPITPTGVGFGGSAALQFPNLTVGSGWNTEVVLINPGGALLTGTIQFFGQPTKSGLIQATKVSINGVAASTFSYSVPPRSASRMRALRVPTSPAAGSARLTPSPLTGLPSSLALISYQTGAATVSVTSLAALPPATAIRSYIESSGVFGQTNSVQTGFNILNPAATHLTAQFDLMNFNGTFTGISTSLSIPAGGQIFRLASELFPSLSGSFRGVLKISASQPVSVAGMRGRYNERGDLLMTTTHPYDDASAPLSEIDMPHIVSGGGFSTELILLSTGPTQTGSLWLLSQDGTPFSGIALLPNP